MLFYTDHTLLLLRLLLLQLRTPTDFIPPTFLSHSLQPQCRDSTIITPHTPAAAAAVQFTARHGLIAKKTTLFTTAGSASHKMQTIVLQTAPTRAGPARLVLRLPPEGHPPQQQQLTVCQPGESLVPSQHQHQSQPHDHQQQPRHPPLGGVILGAQQHPASQWHCPHRQPLACSTS